MADNVTADAGAGGAVFASDDIGGVHYPRTKVVWGADGAANDTTNTSGKGLPVQGEAAHDAATTGNPVLVGAEFDDTTPDAVDEGDVGRLRISSRRELYVQVRDAAGNERGLNVDASGKVAVTTLLDPAIGGSEVQVDVVGALPAGTNAIGKLAANSGVDIGDVDVTSIVAGTGATNLGKAEDGAHTTGDVGVAALAVRRDTAAVGSGTDGDYSTLNVDSAGRLYVTHQSTGKTLLSTGGSAASSGNNTLVAADGSLKLKVFAFSLSTTSTTAMTCIFQSGASGTELWRVIIQAATGTSAGANLTVTPPAWLFSTAAATLLNLNLSSANAVHWSVSYFVEA